MKTKCDEQRRVLHLIEVACMVKVIYAFFNSITKGIKILLKKRLDTLDYCGCGKTDYELDLYLEECIIKKKSNLLRMENTVHVGFEKELNLFCISTSLRVILHTSYLCSMTTI